MRLFKQPVLFGCLIAVCFLSVQASALAATVWSGPTLNFSKSGFANQTLAENQDRIASSVWITRGDTQGIFNAAAESFFSNSSSPADTEWAWDLNGLNTGKDIAAANFANMEFNPWKEAHGGSGGGPLDTVGIPGVLHLISDDVYIDISFTGWGQLAMAGGSFAYTRSTPIPEPSTATLLCVGLLGLATRCRPA